MIEFIKNYINNKLVSLTVSIISRLTIFLLVLFSKYKSHLKVYRLH